MPLYPVNLKIQNRLCLIIGGGEVAARKIEPLLACGAKVRVISPTVGDGIRNLAENGKIEWRRRGFRTGDLQGAFLVFAATDNSVVQKQVVEEARALDVLLNSVDIPEACSFQVPAMVRQGDLLLAVSTGGGSPALSAWIRKELAREYGVEYGLLVDLLASIRSEIVGDGGSPWSHKLVFEKILEMDVLSCLRDRDWPALQARLAPVLPERINVAELVANISAKEKAGNEPGCKDLQDG
jgi:precorrin-2 dehydrogenase